MKLAVLGATGPTGRQVIDQALARGDQVVAYVRRPTALPEQPELQIIGGELSDMPRLVSALTGVDAVLVCLGTQETKNVDLMQRMLPLITAAMQAAKTARIVLLSAYGVGETAQSASLVARLAYKTMMASVFEDKARSEALLPGSGLKWTSVHPVILTDGPAVDDAEVRPMTRVIKVTGLPKVSRANVARAMLDATHDDRTIGQKLLVTCKGSVR